MTNKTQEKHEEASKHWHLIRDVAVFQGKLAIDGLRDLVLLPISLIAGLAGIFISPQNPAKYFNKVLAFGRKSDIWINLFSHSEHDANDTSSQSSDAYVAKLEQMLISEYKRGGVVSEIKDRADQLLDRIQKETATSHKNQSDDKG